MSKPNLINQIIRDQAVAVSLESVQDPLLTDETVLTQSLEQLATELDVLTSVREQTTLARGITRNQALSLEAVEGFKLPFPAQGFTVQPSQTGLRLTTEGIGASIAAIGKKVYELFVKLIKFVSSLFIGNKARAERTREEMKATRREVKELARETPSDDQTPVFTPEQLKHLAAKVFSLAERADFYKSACADAKLYCQLERALECLTADDAKYQQSVDHLRLHGYEQFAKRRTDENDGPLYPDNGNVPSIPVMNAVWARSRSTPKRVLEPLLDSNGGITDLRQLDLFFDKYFDKAMATMGVIDMALLAVLSNFKTIEQQFGQLRQELKDSAVATKRLTELTKIAAAFNNIVIKLKAAQTTVAEREFAEDGQ